MRADSKEVGLLIALQPKRGEMARYFLMFSPKTEWEDYQPVDLAMLDTVRLAELAGNGGQSPQAAPSPDFSPEVDKKR